MGKWFKKKRKRKETSSPSTEASIAEAAAPGGHPNGFPESESPSEPEDIEWIRPLDAEEPVQGSRGEDETDFPEEDSGHEEPSEESDSPGEKEKRRFFKHLRERMQKTRKGLVHRVDRILLGKRTVDEDLLDELEEVLVTSDLGVRTTRRLLDAVAERVKRRELHDVEKLRSQLQEEMRAILEVEAPPWNPRRTRPFVIVMMGVNGVGKTTTMAKLAHRMKQEGLDVTMVAGDTFRAAAIEQLCLWGERIGVPVIRQKSGSDPSAVAFDALEAAVKRDTQVVLLDTAGRMHTKVNLMEELKKTRRVMRKKLPGAPHEALLVLDATTGQNALSQAKLFKEQMDATGLVLTKLDGTAKGGIVVPVCDETGLPVRFIGVGEGVEDLRPFDPREFVRAIF